MKYSRIMIHAFADATGRSIEEALTDLGLAETVKPEGTAKLTPAEAGYVQELLSTEEAVKSWGNVID